MQLPRTKLTAQKAINVKRLFRVDAIDYRQRVEWDFVLLQQLTGGENLVEGRLAAFVDAESVMQFLRAIDTQPDEKLVLAQKRVPLVVQ